MSYLKDDAYSLYFRSGAEAFGYSEGLEVERRLLDIVLSVQDRSIFSQEWLDKIVDWSTRYHFTRARHCLLRPLGIKPGERVLELGCGTGAITRYLGEIGAEVTAVEGSVARARVAAARCHDLPNVAVIADDLQAAEVEGQYDWVTLIGVLEYAGAYSKEEDPYRAYLASAMRHLKPGGRVVIAIENQLGLKYFNGCGEDHLGRLFSGIQDLYQPAGGVRTFGRKALSRVLDEAGLSQQTWMYPYPDYKVPNIVLSDAALEQPHFNAVDLLLRSFSEDYSGNDLRLFDEALVNRVLADNGLLSDFSNSFLVVAAKPSEGVAVWRPEALAWTYAVHRKEEFCTETVFSSEPAHIQVRKRRLLPSTGASVPFLDSEQISLKPADSEYFHGWQQAWDIARAHIQYGTLQPLVEALKPWATAMLAYAEQGQSPLSVATSLPDASLEAFASVGLSGAAVDSTGSRPRCIDALRYWVIPGSLIDHAPFNFLRNAEGKMCLIDQEWHISCFIPAGWVLTRGVLHALQVGVAPKDKLDSVVTVVIALADACGFLVTSEDVQIWLRLEDRFYRTVAAQPSVSFFTGTRIPLRTYVDTLSSLQEQNKTLSQNLEQERSAHHATQQELNRFSAALQAIKQSPSWCVTAPLRGLSASIRRAHRWFGEARRTVALRGGLGSLARQGMRFFCKEGIRGLHRRWKNIGWAASSPVNAVQASLLRPGEDPYHCWLRNYDPTDAASMAALREKIETLGITTTFSVVMPVYNPPLDYLRHAIESVQAQIYPHWEICIADDMSPKQEVRDLLNELAAQDSRIKLVFREKNGHISAATNSAIEIATGDFIALMDNDDVLPPHALAYMALAAHQNPSAGLIYSDEDKITADNVRQAPYFKCQLNYELLLSQNMISHFGVYRRSVLEAIGGFRVGYEGAQDWDLALRVIEKIGIENVVHVPRVLYHWRIFPGSTALALEEKDYALEAQIKSVASHLTRIGKPDTQVYPAPGIPGLLRIKHALPSPLPLVSIIIPIRGQVKSLSRCVDSILEKTSYPDYEILIVDSSSGHSSKAYLQQVVAHQDALGKIKVIEADMASSTPELNNLGVAQAQGEYLVLMNNDIEIIQTDWVEEMLGFAAQSDIGGVGVQIWRTDDTLLHGGIVLGVGGVASYAHKGMPRGNFGYFGRASAHQMFSAVAATCLMVRKSVYQEVGGLDENLQMTCNEVDFCLKMRAKGYRNLYNPFVSVIYHGPGNCSSGIKHQHLLHDVDILKERWDDLIQDDPAYSPNLTLESNNFSMAWPPRSFNSGMTND